MEFSPELHEVAQRNIRTWRLPDQRCFSVESVLADCSKWRIPSGNSVLFFFNPFRAPLLRVVLDGIVQAARPGQEIYLVYLWPSFPEVFTEFPSVALLSQMALGMPLYSIYKVSPSNLLGTAARPGSQTNKSPAVHESTLRTGSAEDSAT